MTNPTAIYNKMLEIKAGTRGCFALSKKEVRQAKVEWGFVENAASILGLKIERRGNYGFLISR